MCGHPDETLFLVFDILLKKSNHYQVVLSKNEVSPQPRSQGLSSGNEVGQPSVSGNLSKKDT